MKFFLLGLGLPLAFIALPAQTPTVTLTPTYQPGEVLYYSATVHSSIPEASHASTATVDVEAEIKMLILPGATPGHYEAEMSFTKFHTTVVSPSPAELTALQAQTTATDHAAATMTPAKFKVGPDAFSVLARPNGAQYDEAVEMLAELARTDALPVAPAAIGSHWTRPSSRPVPQMNFAMPLSQQCSLVSVGRTGDAPSATIHMTSQGSANLPAGSLPGADQMAAQGLVAEPHLDVHSEVDLQYRLADAVLLVSTSQSESHLLIRFVGPQDAQTLDTDVKTTGTVTLERVTGAANPTPPAAAH